MSGSPQSQRSPARWWGGIGARRAALGFGLLLGAGCSSETASSTANQTSGVAAVPRLFFLDIVPGRVHACAPDGTAQEVLVASGTLGSPDGIAVDPAAGFLYWTNMGVASADDGSIQRARLDGSDLTTLVAQGGTFTPKQLALDPDHHRLYWSDREGMAVMRSNDDGTGVETLVTIAEGDTARADASNWAVGVAVDVAAGFLYWTQKGPTDGGKGSIRRAHLDMPAGQDSKTRDDIEVLFDQLPEPIDLQLDLEARMLYWTDRGDNTVSRAPLEPPSGVLPAARTDREVLLQGLGEAIGLSLDPRSGTLYTTALDGRIVAWSASDGSSARTVLEGQGPLTGIVYAEFLP